jgi:hypothetical protein
MSWSYGMALGKQAKTLNKAQGSVHGRGGIWEPVRVSLGVAIGSVG